jgi:hypothetical protein
VELAVVKVLVELVGAALLVETLAEASAGFVLIAAVFVVIVVVLGFQLVEAVVVAVVAEAELVVPVGELLPENQAKVQEGV